jgi:hypothetical protein
VLEDDAETHDCKIIPVKSARKIYCGREAHPRIISRGDGSRIVSQCDPLSPLRSLTLLIMPVYKKFSKQEQPTTPRYAYI